MKRKKKIRKASVILCADIHLREDTPQCRTDEFLQAQWGKLEFIKKLQEKHDCPVLCAGDLFHHWKPSPWLLSQAIEYLPEDFHTVFGQHDLPQHNMALAYKSGIYTLAQANKLNILKEANWGQEPEHGSIKNLGVQETGKVNILVWHKFVWDGKKLPWPGCEESTADEILDKYPQFDLMVTGDHHKPFIFEKEGRLLVNPGCMTRQTADFAEHQPRVYLWYSESNTVEPVYLPIEERVVSREHIDFKEQHDKRIEAYVSKLNNDWETTISFEDNMKRFLSNNNVKTKVSDLIHKAIET